jgi:hypothetical protein
VLRVDEDWLTGRALLPSRELLWPVARPAEQLVKHGRFHAVDPRDMLTWCRTITRCLDQVTRDAEKKGLREDEVQAVRAAASSAFQALCDPDRLHHRLVAWTEDVAPTLPQGLWFASAANLAVALERLLEPWLRGERDLNYGALKVLAEQPAFFSHRDPANTTPLALLR